MISGVVKANGVDLAFDRFGRAEDPAILLMMGNSAPGIVWPDQFCQTLSEANFCVIRYDQRDTGLSTYLEFGHNPYTLNDLADDALALLDCLGIQVAHLVGLSQGGNIAYLAGLKAPSRVLTITSMMSSPDLGPKNDAFTGKPERPGQLPRPAADYVDAVVSLNSAPASSDAEVAERFMKNFKLAAGPKSPFDYEFWRAVGHAVAIRRDAERAKFANHSNHSMAQMATAPLTAGTLRSLMTPCLVVHGECDPIFPIAHAEWAVANLPCAELCIVPNMGHALDPAFFEVLISRVTEFISASIADMGRAAIAADLRTSDHPAGL